MLTLDHDGRRYENADRKDLLRQGVPATTIDAAELDQARAQALADIDQAAGAARGRYLTLIPGQELTYQRKAEQARAFSALSASAKTAAKPEDYPLLAPEAAATGVPLADFCALVLARDAAFGVLGGRIEAARAGGKADVKTRVKLNTIADARATALAALAAI